MLKKVLEDSDEGRKGLKEDGEESEHKKLLEIEKTISKKHSLSVDFPLRSLKQKTLGEQSSTNTKPSRFMGDQVVSEISTFFLKQTSSIGQISDVPVGPP